MLTSRKMKSKNKKKYLIIFSILIVAALLFFLGLFFYKNNSKKQKTTEILPTINYAEATIEEKKQADDNKDSIVKAQSAPQSQNTSTKKAVTPIITNTSGSINGYIAGIFEEGGICTALISNGAKTVELSSSGFQNVSYTQCAPIVISQGLLTTGDWNVILKYSSPAAQGQSSQQVLEIK
jgi:hypothetical protein